MEYVRVTKTVKDSGVMIPESEVEKVVNPSLPYFRSPFYYSEEAFEYFKKNKNSIKGYRGRVKTPYLYFDLDSKDLEVSRENTIRLIDFLKEKNLYTELAAQISFSGSKGFHLFIKTAYNFTSSDLKLFCKEITKEVEFVKDNGKNFKIDTTVYNTNRIIRIVNTKHEKSGLFKINVAEQDLRTMSVKEISEYAKKPQRVFEYEDSIKSEVVEELLNFYKNKIKKSKKNKKIVKPKENKNCDINQYPCYKAIQEGDIQAGESNSALLRLAQFYKDCGSNEEYCRTKLLEAGKAREEKYPETNPIDDEKIDYEILSCIYGGEGYSFGISDDLLKSKCTNKDCLLHNPPIEKKNYNAALPKMKAKQLKKDDKKPLNKRGFSGSIGKGVAMKKQTDMTDRGFKTFKETNKGFESFAKDIVKRRIKTGISEFDDYVSIIPNGLTIINAKQGVGKSTLLLNMLKNASQSGISSLFYCADMEEYEFNAKARSSVLEMSPDDIYSLYQKEGDKFQELRDKANKLVEKTLNNIYPCYQNIGLTADKIRNDIKFFKTQGIEIGAVFIDYIQKMEGCHDYGKGTENLFALKNIISEEKVPIIALSQIPGSAIGNEETPIHTARAAKGGSIYEETASVVINIWRPMKFHSDSSKDMYLGAKIAKNRMGECPPDFALYFNGASSVIRSLNDQEYQQYEEDFEEYQESKRQKSKKRGAFR